MVFFSCGLVEWIVVISFYYGEYMIDFVNFVIFYKCISFKYDIIVVNFDCYNVVNGCGFFCRWLMDK